MNAYTKNQRKLYFPEPEGDTKQHTKATDGSVSRSEGDSVIL